MQINFDSKRSDENVRFLDDLFVESMEDAFFSMYACNRKAREDMGE